MVGLSKSIASNLFSLASASYVFDDKTGSRKSYRSGAEYLGDLDGNRRSGRGSFKWPNGAMYDGEFKNNIRQGHGMQSWPDGSVYVGNFEDDVRHGSGEVHWLNGERYKGEFFKDKRQGRGCYMWPDKSKYEGFFKDDKRWGYGVFTYASGLKFEGIYRNDVRNGPGILHYTNGKQDFGIWSNERLIKICTKIKKSFSFHRFTQHAINAVEDESPTKVKKEIKLKKNKKQIISPSGSINMEDELMLQIPNSFPYINIMQGARGHSEKGPLEIVSEELISSAAKGDASTVEKLLKQRDVHPDVADRNGYTAVLAAAVNCHVDVLNHLLDYGANVNKLNEEGLSALAACHVLLYTAFDFIDNIAENMPAENLFNSVEWDKQRGMVTNRNDRKIILATYGTLRRDGTIGSIRTEKKISGASARSTRAAIGEGMFNTATELNASNNEVDDENDEQTERNKYDNWKLAYYQKTLDRPDELEEINRHFQKLTAHPFDYDNIMEKADPPPLTKLTAEDMAVLEEKTMESSDEANLETEQLKKSLNITDISVLGYMTSEAVLPPMLAKTMDDAKLKLLNAERKPHLRTTIELLLSRGADPNAPLLPMPVLFFAVKAGDKEAVESLLSKGADTSIRLESKCLGLAPLHIAVAIPCIEGIEITKSLLEAGANPDFTDLAFGEKELGRTPLHIASCREDNDRYAQKVIELLMKYKANPDLLCQGHSPLSLAIASGNDVAVDTLLKNGANPSLKLSHGVGSAFCAAVSFTAERRRKPGERLKLIDRLVRSGADLLAPVVVADKFPPGTAVDYAYHVFNQDRRIAHTPYHALSALERACHNNRKEVLEYLGDLLRTAALKREKDMLAAELTQLTKAKDGCIDRLPEDQPEAPVKTASFVEDSPKGRRSKLQRSTTQDSNGRKTPSRDQNCGLPFVTVRANDPRSISALEMNAINQRRLEAKRRFRYCYECGRLIGVRLAACTRCKEVFYCSKNCKVKAWNLRHREECARLSGRRSPSPTSKKTESPTPTTDVDHLAFAINETIKTGKTEQISDTKKSGKETGHRRISKSSLKDTSSKDASSKSGSSKFNRAKSDHSTSGSKRTLKT